jgi:Protein of unknown function (DUF3224)
LDRKVLAVAVALLAIAMLATPLVGMVYAKPPTLVTGSQTVTDFTPIANVPKGKSDNHVVTEMLVVEWTGDIAGVATYTGILMVHDDPVPINIHEKIYFEDVTVLGKSGSLTLQVSANLARGQDVFRWTIIDGTDELANLHGKGIYWLNFFTMAYDYEGQIHFDP